MRCEDAREHLSAARYGNELPETVTQHLATCAECRAAQGAQRELDAWLGSDEPATPRPGFDTRFFARLGEERTRTRRRRWARLGFALLPVAAAIALVALRRSEPLADAPDQVPAPDRAEPIPGVAHEDLDLAVDLELLEELEVVEHMEELETFDELAGVDEHELEALLEDAP